MPAPAWIHQWSQTSLFSRPDTRLNSGLVKVVVGQFFEVLASGILKGECAGTPPGWDVYPDVVKWGKRTGDRLFEIKGAGRTGWIIDTGQVSFYEGLESRFPFTDPIVQYVGFVHSGQDLKKNCRTVQELILLLAQSVVGGIVFPLPVIRSMVDGLKNYEYKAWGDGCRGGERHPHFVRLRGTWASRWIQYPESMVDDFELKFKRPIRVSRRRIKAARIMDATVNAFPLLVVSTMSESG